MKPPLESTICSKCNCSFGISTNTQWTVEACNGNDKTCNLNKMEELKHCIGCDKYVKHPCENGFVSLTCKNAYGFKLINIFNKLINYVKSRIQIN